MVLYIRSQTLGVAFLYLIITVHPFRQYCKFILDRCILLLLEVHVVSDIRSGNVVLYYAWL